MKPFCLISLTDGGFFLLGLHSCSIPWSGSSLSFASNHSYTSSTAELPQLKISQELILITFLPQRWRFSRIGRFLTRLQGFHQSPRLFLVLMKAGNSPRLKQIMVLFHRTTGYVFPEEKRSCSPHQLRLNKLLLAES